MSLHIFNSLSKKIEKFQPLEEGVVRMYVCGMTVYDYCHLGHARAMMAFDVVQRWLKVSGYKVVYVRNVTDIDDKIIERAVQNGESIESLTHRMIAALYEDADALGIERPTHTPHARDYVPQMLQLIQTLQDKGYAYTALNTQSLEQSDERNTGNTELVAQKPLGSDVNYRVRKFVGYGKLSGKSLDDLRAGERVAVVEQKEDALDFALWKGAKPSEPLDAQWDSPYGKGRPGWHIECSAMSCALLGESFDIHGGGADLQFPHHENEIAQSEAANGKPLARYWMHNGFVMRDDVKMSKSLGNFFTIRDILNTFDAQTLRFFMLRAHYRSPLNYSDAHLRDAHSALKRLYTALDLVTPTLNATIDAIDWENPFASRFKSALDDDFSTPEAIAVLFDLASEINKAYNDKNPKVTELAALLTQLGACLGLLQGNPKDFLQNMGTRELDASRIDTLIAQRQAAKTAKNFAQADDIRQQLLSEGVVLKDTPQGTVWEVLAK